MNIKADIIRTVAGRIPHVIPHLEGEARQVAITAPDNLDEVKTVAFYLRTITNLVESVYAGRIRREFISIMNDLIYGQLTQAWNTALTEAGADMTPDMQAELDGYIASERSHVENYYNDILNAGLTGKPIEPLLNRAAMWANRWTDVYNAAKLFIASVFGERLKWVFGDADHCTTCEQLNGIVAFATEWDTLGCRPQNPPNSLLECQGWNCKCTLEPTSQRRSPKAFETIQNIVTVL